IADSSKLRAHTGWQPHVDFAEGLRRTIRYYTAPGTEPVHAG
ncbi:MAG: GDP-mannose 4,6 dehydratase, partial [Chloroflexota bacterium]